MNQELVRRAALRRWASRVGLVGATFSLAIAVVFGWVHATVFDRDEFSARAIELLDSSAVRSALAERISDQIIQKGPSSLVSYRAVIVVALEGVTQTDAFKEVFKRALRSAHDAVFAADGDSVVLNLIDSLNVIRGTLEVVSPDAARQLPSDVGDLVVDLTNEIRSLELWQVGEELDELVGLLYAAAIVGFAAAIAFAVDRRLAVIRAGVGLVVAGALVLVLIVVARHLGTAAVADPELRGALAVTIDVATADLRSSAIWLAGYGVLIAAVATAPAGAGRRVSYEMVRDWFRRYAVGTPASTGARLARGGLLLVLGGLVVANTSAVLNLAALVAGALVAYIGATELVAAVGRVALPAPGAPGELAASVAGSGSGAVPGEVSVEGAGVGRPVRWAPAVLAGVVLLLVLTTVGLIIRSRAASSARAASIQRCNGHAELCGKRLDEVVFPSTHNSMSAAREKGWLFGEHLGGIRAQLEYGIRGFLIDTHYGVPSGITVPGSDVEIVLTDKNAELHRDELNEQLSTEQRDRVEDLARRAGGVTGKPRDVYLCHNFCELGATRFADALKEFRTFLESNPNEVLILFIEDYVTTTETGEAFVEAGLADRLWTHSPGQLWPTLGEMIASRRQILVLSEHQAPPPDWYHDGFTLVEETRYTFSDIADFDCAPNRGGTGRDLFLINHWLNKGSPDIRAAEAANQREVLEQRVERCRDERDRLPTMIAVDFYDKGDLLAVVDALNGVDRD